MNPSRSETFYSQRCCVSSSTVARRRHQSFVARCSPLDGTVQVSSLVSVCLFVCRLRRSSSLMISCSYQKPYVTLILLLLYVLCYITVRNYNKSMSVECTAGSHCVSNRQSMNTGSAFHKVVRWHILGEVDKYTTFWCNVSSGLCVPKIIEIAPRLTELFYKKRWQFF